MAVDIKEGVLFQFEKVNQEILNTMLEREDDYDDELGREGEFYHAD